MKTKRYKIKHKNDYYKIIYTEKVIMILLVDKTTFLKSHYKYISAKTCRVKKELKTAYKNHSFNNNFEDLISN